MTNEAQQGLPVVAYLYAEGAKALKNEGCGLVYQQQQVFHILPHQDPVAAFADHAVALARIQALERENERLRQSEAELAQERVSLVARVLELPAIDNWSIKGA